jgi:hypothetical protein
MVAGSAILLSSARTMTFVPKEKHGAPVTIGDMVTGLRYRQLLQELKAQIKERGKDYHELVDLIAAFIAWSDGVQLSKGRSVRIVQCGLANHSSDVRGIVHSKVGIASCPPDTLLDFR